MQQPYRPRQLQPNTTNTATSTSTTTSDSESPSGFPPVLRLRGASQSHVTTTDNHDAPESTEQRSTADGSAAPRVRWDENVVNNEGMGKKSSKVCCIYHRPRAIGESSSESDSSSSDDSDDSDDDADVRSKCRHDQAVPCGYPDHVHGSNQEHGTRRTRRRKPSPNAYERQPRNERKHTKQQSKADS